MGDMAELDEYDFDPSDIQIVHYNALLAETPSTWVDSQYNRVSLRSTPVRYLKNIKRWICQHDTTATPYIKTPQYGYIYRLLEEKGQL